MKLVSVVSTWAVSGASSPVSHPCPAVPGCDDGEDSQRTRLRELLWGAGLFGGFEI